MYRCSHAAAHQLVLPCCTTWSPSCKPAKGTLLEGTNHQHPCQPTNASSKLVIRCPAMTQHLLGQLQTGSWQQRCMSLLPSLHVTRLANKQSQANSCRTKSMRRYCQSLHSAVFQRKDSTCCRCDDASSVEWFAALQPLKPV